ncbi:hypothetical protein [Alysiella crassa]|uniref:Uncharacterized protein n=1 Tax=Alysiella crassa TaxID=153491 RepID=A0A376BTM1_9NEIS|nr:hypothetical protein [Alysiella crassa]UOP05778.1 hypothetical protein LVJ80_07655 [Alysiella crassa]UOP08105.1 hypothetical protein LVJ80_07335 [Alysiella crassa]SSY80188.1 Uncharacterised protein [Alysiella crassa]
MSSINGFGTTFYGECDYQSDGSYTSTYWIILAFIPVIPLYSARILHKEGTRYQYVKIPINWQQVFRIWAFIAAWISGYWMCVMWINQAQISKRIDMLILITYTVIMLLLPSFLRYQAKKRIVFQPHVQLLPAISKKTIFLVVPLIIGVALLLMYLHMEN